MNRHAPHPCRGGEIRVPGVRGGSPPIDVRVVRVSQRVVSVPRVDTAGQGVIRVPSVRCRQGVVSVPRVGGGERVGGITGVGGGKRVRGGGDERRVQRKGGVRVRGGGHGERGGRTPRRARVRRGVRGVVEATGLDIRRRDAESSNHVRVLTRIRST